MPQAHHNFITLEGGEGAGKSTQAKLLGEALQRRGHRIMLTREPGGSPGAEKIRQLLLEGEAGRWDAKAEALLLFAARRTHLRETILPALARGEVVICDRFTDSTMAYQGIAGGLGRQVVEQMAALALDAGCPGPGLTLILDIPVALGLGRAKSRSGKTDRFESLGEAFHQSLRDAYLEIALRDPGRCAVIDATPDPAAVASAITAVVSTRLKL